jgi:acyl transferase domain-containing protein
VDGAFLRPRYGAFVADVECFDAQTFDISAPELALMDAKQRLLLVSSTDSLRSATVFMTGAKTKFPIGVYVGISSMMFRASSSGP